MSFGLYEDDLEVRSVFGDMNLRRYYKTNGTQEKQQSTRKIGERESQTVPWRDEHDGHAGWSPEPWSAGQPG